MRKPLWQFLWLFIRMSFVGALVITFNNMLNGITFSELLELNLILIGGQIGVFVTLFLSVVWFRLRGVFRSFGTVVPADEVFSKEQIMKYGQLCLKFPFSLFRGFLFFAVLASVGFHVLDWWHYQYEWEWGSFFELVAIEQTLSWLLALMLYNGTRRILRPVISWLNESAPMGLGVRMSFRKRVIGVVMALTILTGMDYVSYDLNYLDQSGSHAMNLLGIFLMVLTLSYFFARSAIDDTVHDIDQVRKSLAEFNRLEFPHSTGRVKVESADEVGDLKVQFNSLQEKAERYYKNLSQELELAYRVQQSLLPSTFLTHGNVTIQGHSLSAQDLGGDFYDYAQMDDRTLVMMIGDVSGKGLPSSLITATVLGIFRAELRHGGTAAEILQRINGSISEVLMPGMFVTAAIIMIDTDSGDFQYASAGHLPPIHASRNGITEWETSSFPLGFDVEEPVAVISGKLTDEDSIVFYTDGLLEAKSEAGEIVGFDQLLKWVLDGYANSLDVIDEITRSLETFRGQTPREDDETIVILHFRSRLLPSASGKPLVNEVGVQ